MEQSEIIEELIEYGINICPVKLGSLINLLGEDGLKSQYGLYGAFNDINGAYIKSTISEDEDSETSYYVFFIPLDDKKLHNGYPLLDKDDMVGIVMISVLKSDGLFSVQKDLLFLNTQYAQSEKKSAQSKYIIEKEYKELC